MEARDLCNWLQGYFDMAAPGNGLDANKTETVRKHLTLVFSAGADKVGFGPQAQFCRWLDGVLEAQAEMEPHAGVGPRMVDLIQERLRKTLAAPASPSPHAQPPSQQDLADNPKVTMRC